MSARSAYVRTLQVVFAYGVSEWVLHISHRWPLLGHVA